MKHFENIHEGRATNKSALILLSGVPFLIGEKPQAGVCLDLRSKTRSEWLPECTDSVTTPYKKSAN